MRIKYQTVEDDYVAFNVFFSRHSPLAKRSRLIAGVLIPAIFIVLVLSQAIYSHDWTYMFIGVLFFGSLSLVILVGRSDLARRTAKKIFKEGKNKGFLGNHELEINDYGILTKSEYGEGKIAWAVIERIGSTPDYTFIFTGASTAFIVPKARIIEGDYNTFFEELNSLFAKYAAMAPASPDKVREKVFVDLKPVACDDKRAGKHSGYGIASFVLALISIAAVLLAFMAAVIIVIIIEEPADKAAPLFAILSIGLVLAWSMSFVGAGLGIAGLLSKNRKKPFAIVGFILNLMIVAGVVPLMVLARFHS